MSEILQLIKEAAVPLERADILPNLFGENTQDVLNGNRSVVMYGAGSAGRELLPVLRLHGVFPVCFCDKNSQEYVAELNDIPVISFQELCNEYKASLIVISSGKYSEEIKKDLLDNGFNSVNVICINEEQLFFYTTVYQWYWPEIDLNEKQVELQTAYDLLSDQKSKDIFVDRISSFSAGTDYGRYRRFVKKHADLEYSLADTHSETDISMHESTFYFHNDVLEIEQGEVLVDGGGYIGDSALEFINLVKGKSLGYEKIYTFEPDPKNFTQLVNNLSESPNIEWHNLGLWESETTVKFISSDTVESYGGQIDAGCRIDMESGDIGVDTTSIDICCGDEKVSFIKLDVEGAEIEALKGAKNTIIKNRPKFALSAYHKRNDIFDILLKINEIVPNYKFYLRHYSNNFVDTILFALPQ